MKNEVNLKWSGNDELAEFDKDQVRNNLYESIKACVGEECANIRAVLLECFRVITCCDFPEKMGNLINVIVSDICQREDSVRVIVALTALRQALSSYEYSPNDSPAIAQSINSIVDMISHPLISVASEAANSGISNSTAATVIHYVVKIYWSFALLSNATCDKLAKLAPSWNQLLLFVLASDYSQATAHGNVSNKSIDYVEILHFMYEIEFFTVFISPLDTMLSIICVKILELGSYVSPIFYVIITG